MTRIKDYLQTLNEEGLSSHLSGGDSSGASFDPAVAEESKAPVLTGTDVQETQTQAADDEAETDTAPKAAKAVKSEKKTNGAQGKVVAVDTRVRAVQEMTVVASNKASANKVVPVEKKVVLSEKKVVPVKKKLELLPSPKVSNGDAEIPSALSQVQKSIVTITVDGTVGKGFICNQDGRIATSCGLVNSASRIKVTTSTGDVFLGKVVGLHRDQDLAIVQIPTKTPEHLPIAATSVDVGEDIFILNSASGSGELTRAVINAVRVIGGTMLLQIDQPIPSSDCGSPLFTEQGTVIGIVSEKVKRDIKDTGFGVRLEELDNLSAESLT